jgi:hypothetical protein
LAAAADDYLTNEPIGLFGAREHRKSKGNPIIDTN